MNLLNEIQNTVHGHNGCFSQLTTDLEFGDAFLSGHSSLQLFHECGAQILDTNKSTSNTCVNIKNKYKSYLRGNKLQIQVIPVCTRCFKQCVHMCVQWCLKNMCTHVCTRCFKKKFGILKMYSLGNCK